MKKTIAKKILLNVLLGGALLLSNIPGTTTEAARLDVEFVASGWVVSHDPVAPIHTGYMFKYEIGKMYLPESNYNAYVEIDDKLMRSGNELQYPYSDMDRICFGFKFSASSTGKINFFDPLNLTDIPVTQNDIVEVFGDHSCSESMCLTNINGIKNVTFIVNDSNIASNYGDDIFAPFNSIGNNALLDNTLIMNGTKSRDFTAFYNTRNGKIMGNTMDCNKVFLWGDLYNAYSRNLNGNSGDVIGNHLNINGSNNMSIRDRANIYGAASLSGGGDRGVVQNNTINIRDSILNDAPMMIYGGYNCYITNNVESISGNSGIVSGNKVIIDNCPVIAVDGVCGGFSDNGNVKENEVIFKEITDIYVKKIFGGKSYKGTVEDNIVNIDKCRKSDEFFDPLDEIYGGCAGDDYYDFGENGVVNRNQVTISNSDCNFVYGGWNYRGTETAANIVSVDNSNVMESIYGGFGNLKIHDNKVIIEDSIVGDEDRPHTYADIIGGYSNRADYSKANVYDNEVIIKSGQIYGSVIGGAGDMVYPTINIDYGKSYVKGNKVIIEGGTFERTRPSENRPRGFAVGGYGLIVEENQVTVTGGTVGDVYGGYGIESLFISDTVVQKSSVCNNMVTIENGVVNGIYGGYSFGYEFALVENNKIYINGGTVKNINDGELATIAVGKIENAFFLLK